MSIRSRVAGILAAAAIVLFAAAPAANAAPAVNAAPAASTSRASYPGCSLVFGAITVHVSEAVTISGHQSAGTVYLDIYAGPGQSGLETVDIVTDHVTGAERWYGPGPHLNLGSDVTVWRWGWDDNASPVLTVSGVGSRWEQRTCSVRP